MTTANRLTFLRILIVPFFVLIGSLPGYEIWAAALFFLAAITDFLDGYIARRHNQITTLGKFLDPLADKMLASAAFIILVSTGRLMAWIAILIICREFIVSGIRIIGATKGQMIAASNLGKIKTVVQIITILFLFLMDLPFLPVSLTYITAQIMIYATIIITLYSGIDYIVKGQDLFKN